MDSQDTNNTSTDLTVAANAKSNGYLDKITYLSVQKIQPTPRNARTHSGKQIQQIANSIERFGFNNPVLIDAQNVVIAGNGRLAAAKLLGWNEVPCVRISHLSKQDQRAFVLADNKLALNADWDEELLAFELQELSDINFDLGLTGFELPEVDLILSRADDISTHRDQTNGNDIPEPSKASDAVTQLGDVWKMGRHTLLCADAQNTKAISEFMGDEQADMIFTDPPYNLEINGTVSGLGRTKHREFLQASGEMSTAEFTDFLSTTLGNSALVCRDGAIAFVCMDWRHLQEMHEAGHKVFSELKNLCVWSKTNAGMGSFYRSKHELVFVWKIGTAPHTNTFGLGDKGRYRTNVWTYAGVNTFKLNRTEELTSHPTVKPVALVADAIRDVSNRGDIVLDIFGGSGTTLIAAHSTGRTARLVEIDPTYCDVIIRRWQSLTGSKAILHENGKSFEHVSSTRTGWGAISTGGTND